MMLSEQQIAAAMGNFGPLVQRLHAVMDQYKINHRHDLAFLGEIMWILDLDFEFRITPCEQLEPTP